MKIKYKTRSAAAVWLVALVLIGLLAAACGGATTPETEEATPVESAETADTPSSEEAAGDDTTDTAAAESTSPEAEATNEENLLDPDQALSPTGVASCATATPQNDPLMAALQPNELLAAVTADEWSRGPVDAPVTLVEYSDFQ
jgi:protein-disulfide isomerase